MAKMMVLMRGLPGSGKSTVARDLAAAAEENGLRAIICSADDYFMEDGHYVYKPGEQGRAHVFCQASVDRSLANGYDLVIVDNTNIKKEHMRYYAELAKLYKYSVSTRPVGGRGPSEVECYFQRQAHGVPRETLERMARDYED